MNLHLRQRVEALFACYDTAILATCGQAGPQISTISYEVQHLHLHLLVPHGSDHLFNLETQPELVVLSPTWRLHGRTAAADDVATLHEGQCVVRVQPGRLHVLSQDGRSILETIDF